MQGGWRHGRSMWAMINGISLLQDSRHATLDQWRMQTSLHVLTNIRLLCLLTYLLLVHLLIMNAF